MEFLLSPIGLVVIGLLGMLVHFFKKQIKGETLTEIKDYFGDHFKSTFIAVVTTIIGVITYKFSLGTGLPADIITVFGIGYTFDSIFNKWDKSNDQ
jgi:Na+/proline symporter